MLDQLIILTNTTVCRQASETSDASSDSSDQTKYSEHPGVAIDLYNASHTLNTTNRARKKGARKSKHKTNHKTKHKTKQTSNPDSPPPLQVRLDILRKLAQEAYDSYRTRRRDRKKHKLKTLREAARTEKQEIADRQLIESYREYHSITFKTVLREIESHASKMAESRHKAYIANLERIEKQTLKDITKRLCRLIDHRPSDNDEISNPDRDTPLEEKKMLSSFEGLKIKGEANQDVIMLLKDRGWKMTNHKKHLTFERYVSTKDEAYKCQTFSMSKTPSDWRGRVKARRDLIGLERNVVGVHA